MVEFGTLNEADAKRLARTDLGLIPPERRRTTGQYFLEFVQQTLEAKYGADMVFKGGLNVYTTLNPSMQLAAEQVAPRRAASALEGRTGKTARPGEQPEGALITIDPATGHIKASSAATTSTERVQPRGTRRAASPAPHSSPSSTRRARGRA